MSQKYIPLQKAAKAFGLEPSYAAELARKSVQSGNPFPVKRGQPWEATWEEWRIIFNPPGKRLRKKRKRVGVAPTKETATTKECIACTKAARLKGISHAWALELGRRAIQNQYAWPRMENGQWLAPAEEWFKIFDDPDLRRRKKRK